MTNREKFKDELDAMLVSLMTVVHGKPVICDNASCRECLFEKSCGKNTHKQEIIDWLNAEYQEPSVDWSKVPIDTPVLAQDSSGTWHRMHFAGRDDLTGWPCVYIGGTTSWSNNYGTLITQNVKLAEGNE